MPDKCLPEHLQGKRHDDWLWPLSLIPRGWNAFCGDGPIWHEEEGYESNPIPQPGFKCKHSIDKNGASRKYWGVTFKWKFLYGFHIRIGMRFDDVDIYYNWLPISFGFEYDKEGNPI